MPLYSTSMKKGRIILNTADNFAKQVRESGNLVSLRLSFQCSRQNDIISFFVNARITGYSEYSTPDSGLKLCFFILYTEAADDMIVILGQLLEANIKLPEKERLKDYS